MSSAPNCTSIRTPARWLWVLLLVLAVYLVPQLNLAKIVESAKRPISPLAHELWPERLLLLAGCLVLLIAGRIRARTIRAFLPYVLPLTVSLVSVGNLLMFPETNMYRPGWRFIRKYTGSLTEAALKSPSHFHHGRGKLCLMLRDYVGDHTIVSHVDDICQTSYQALILPDLAVRHAEKAMAVTRATADYLESLPGSEITVSDGTTYRFVQEEMAEGEEILHLRCRETETHFFVPRSVYEAVSAGPT